MTSGKETMRPDLRPATSNVTRELEATPDEAAVAHALFRILAIQLGRCPRYNHRWRAALLTNAVVPSILSLRLPTASA
jgi:hypothetical protein